jgi:HK97 family phage prohead protease
MTATATRPTLERQAPFEFTRADDDTPGDGLSLNGYAAVYNTPTLIDSWEGTFYEQIKRGAFAKTIRENTPVLQFDHGRHPLIGSIPIGTIKTLREDDHGLAVNARMSSNWLIEPIREAIAEQSIKGMSFRFEVIKDEWRDTHGKLISNLEELQKLLWDSGDRGPLQRTLKEVRLRELGPVVWPAYAETEVSLRSRQVVDALAIPAVRAEVARLMFVTPDDVVPDAETDVVDIEPVREDHSNDQDSEVSEVRAVLPVIEEQAPIIDEPVPAGDHSSMTRSKHLRKAQISRVFSRVESSGMRYRSNDSGRYRTG